MDALTYNRTRKYSPEVIKQIQRVVGVELDGTWGQATVAGVIEFQQDNGLDADGKVGPGTLNALQAADREDDDGSDHAGDDVDVPANPSGAPLEQLRTWCADNHFELIDYRDLKLWPRNKRYTKDYGYPLDKSRANPPKGGIRRPWKSITAFMLHTTAVAGMNAKRGLGIPSHFYLPKEDALVLSHEMELLLYHGHSPANTFTVGLEISGDSDWDNPNQADRAKALLRYFQAARRAAIGDDAKCYVMTHRQSHASRGKDPGMQIWQDVGEWAIDELGFELGPVVGTGRDIDEWRIKRA